MTFKHSNTPREEDTMTEPKTPSSRKNEWAVILAGGDGTRLKSLTRKIAGDERPKQFCRVMGGATLVEETQRRAASEFARERTLYVVNRLHQNYYEPILGSEPGANLVIQPHNAGTAPAVLYAALRIAAHDPGAVVALFPSDHYVSDNRKFMTRVRSALNAAQRRSDLIILLGIEPESPEVEYGWIEPSRPIEGLGRICCVRRFWEKPHRALAQALQLRGCLWNSFVIAASARALIGIIEASTPGLYRGFAQVVSRFGTRAEFEAVESLYAHLGDINFSREVLALHPERLAVLRVSGIRWNDLGEAKRVIASLAMAGVRPHWLDTPQPQYI